MNVSDEQSPQVNRTSVSLLLKQPSNGARYALHVYFNKDSNRTTQVCDKELIIPDSSPTQKVFAWGKCNGPGFSADPGLVTVEVRQVTGPSGNNCNDDSAWELTVRGNVEGADCIL